MSKSMKGSSVLQPLLGSLLKCDLRTALRQIHSLPVPTTNDLDAWSAYWKAHNQPWRTEPEIDTKRQKELVARCTIIPDIKHGIYPFTGMKLNRADIEWLLGSHENGCGPVNHGDESQWKHNELDLRDADLRGQDLHNLPLMHMLGSLRWQEWAYTTPEQREAAVVHLEGANLSYTHLEKANLRGAHLERANLYAAHLEGTGLYAAHLEGANLKQAFFDSSTQLRKSILGNKTIGSALLADVRWGDVDVTGINWTTIAVLGDERRAQLLKRGTKDKKSLLEEYLRALRANRQLAVLLQAQGLNEDAAHFAYRAQKLHRIILRFQMLQEKVNPRQRSQRLGAWLFSWFLYLLAGYGYKPERSFLAYLLVISVFMTIYHLLDPHLALNQAFVVSMTAFHGRGFSPSEFKPGDPLSFASAIEALVGLIIEVTFIATLTQRFFNR